MILYSSHQMLAMLTRVPELEVSPDEAQLLGKGIANVSKHYDTGVVSQKTLDWISLAQCLGVVYGPRIFAARMRRQTAAQERAAANVQAETSMYTAPAANEGMPPPARVQI